MIFPIGVHGSETGWEDDAACRGHDPQLFFGPNRFEPKAERLEREQAAKRICATCPVTAECLQHALVVEEAFGVWGGLGETERRGLAADHARRVARAG